MNTTFEKRVEETRKELHQVWFGAHITKVYMTNGHEKIPGEVLKLEDKWTDFVYWYREDIALSDKTDALFIFFEDYGVLDILDRDIAAVDQLFRDYYDNNLESLL